MNQADIHHIEQELKVQLPIEYQEILQNYPSQIEAAKELHLSDDAGWLIDQNLELRANPASFFLKKDWNPAHLVIGEDGNGNCFYLDLHQNASPVYRLRHDDPNSTQADAVAPSITAWIPLIFEDLKEMEQNALAQQQNLKSRSGKTGKTKPWWRFW